MPLETPLEGRSLKEGRVIYFGPPPWYLQLTWATAIGGLLLTVFGTVTREFYYIWVGGMVLIAGLWAFASMSRITIDTKTRLYRRWYGDFIRPRMSQGPIESLDRMILVAEESYLSHLGTRTIIYRIVLLWKGHREPPMVVEQKSVQIPSSAPINSGNQAIGARGWEFARQIGIHWEDHSSASTPSPVPVL